MSTNNNVIIKDLAFYFLDKINDKDPESRTIARTVRAVRTLIERGYSSDDIRASIDYIIQSGKKIYSIGYIIVSIDDILIEINKAKENEKYKHIAAEQQAYQSANREVVSQDDSSDRNKRKVSKFNAQSRLREKFDFDMFEKQ